MWKLVSHFKESAQMEGVWEQIADDTVWIYEELSDTRSKKCPS
jgi:hypothetical protein